MLRQQRELAGEPLGQVEEFATAVLEGLSRPLKALPCRFFYDACGSELFEEITRLPEYYPTRAETQILTAHAGEIAAVAPPGGVLVEFGSGSSRKTELLLGRLADPKAYVSIDVSRTALEEAKRRLVKRFPWLDVRPLVGDFASAVTLPLDLAPYPKTGFFPGSTIGNLTPVEAQRLLRAFARLLAPGGRLLVGVDLKKDVATLNAAYNDKAGVTAAFNLNLLARINRQLGGTFDLDRFRHTAIYNARSGRIEMYLVSLQDQEMRVLGRSFRFAKGEAIHTENSYKYSPRQFQDLARAAAWRPERMWLDRDRLFSVHALCAEMPAR
jgi:dimethylhistidine N-methyltransferase